MEAGDHFLAVGAVARALEGTVAQHAQAIAVVAGERLARQQLSVPHRERAAVSAAGITRQRGKTHPIQIAIAAVQ